MAQVTFTLSLIKALSRLLVSAPLQIFQTADGSPSLLRTDLGETYHSRHGALTESEHVFIRHGLDMFRRKERRVDILELGFGSGLNALLSLGWAREHFVQVGYCGYECHPVPIEMAAMLHFFAGSEDALQGLHRALWGEKVLLEPFFEFEKRHAGIEDVSNTGERFDLVYFDAFAPSVQPELWTRSVFALMFEVLRPGGMLVTYCAKGDVRRTLQACGFAVERLPGPPRKREMLRALKPHSI